MSEVRQLPSGRWRWEVFKDGMRRSGTEDTKGRAESERDAVAEQIEGGDSGHTLQAAGDRYLREVMPRKRGASRETFRLNAIMKYFAEKKVKKLIEVTSEEIGRWRDQRLKEISDWSVLREKTILQSVFKVARCEWKWMTHDPFEGVWFPPNPDPRHQRWRWREICRVLRFLNYRHLRVPETKYQEVALAFMIGLTCGLRAGEILKVGPGTLRGRVLILESPTKGSKVAVGRTKGKKSKPVEVPLPSRAARLCALVRGWTIDRKMLDACFRKARDACLVLDNRFHDSRATALTLLSRRVDILTLSRISRHKDLRILQRVYYRETAEEISRRLK